MIHVDYERHGALMILDEFMSGMGRTETLHAWQSEEVGVVPDIQTIGKGLGGGYAPVAGSLINKRVVNVLRGGSGALSHAQTYQCHTGQARRLSTLSLKLPIGFMRKPWNLGTVWPFTLARGL